MKEDITYSTVLENFATDTQYNTSVQTVYENYSSNYFFLHAP